MRPSRVALRMLGIIFFAASVLTTGSYASADTSISPIDPESRRETVEFYGEQVDAEVAKYLEGYATKNGLDLALEFEETPILYAGQVKGDGFSFYASNRGGVEVPWGYIYNPALGSLHDYCTLSPDQFPAPGENADFSGACARHDMCYERTRVGDKAAFRNCDWRFRADLLTVCRAVYTSPWDPRRIGCEKTANLYYEAVKARHWDNYR